MTRAALAVSAVALAVLFVNAQTDSAAERPVVAGRPERLEKGATDTADVTAATAQRIALIDMAHVFKNYARFEKLRDELKEKIEVADREARQVAARIKEMQEQLKSGVFKARSADYVDLETEIATETAKFEAWRKKNQQRFLRDEAGIYKTIYLEISDVVQKHAENEGFTLVLRFDHDQREEMQQIDDPDKILKSLNATAIYWKPEIDITDAVIDRLKRREQMAMSIHK